MKPLRSVVALPCAALNALAYTTGFALGRVVEAHYRRNLARVVPQPERVVVVWRDPQVITERIRQRAELQLHTGLADLDFALWQKDREKDVRKAQ